MHKKGFVSMHPGMFFLIGLLVGAAIIYFLIMSGRIPVVKSLGSI